MTYCEKCMRPLEGKSVCSVCGRLPQAPAHHLSPGTVLQEKYLAGRAVAEDSGSITYIGRDLSTDTTVVLREYYPAEDAWRDNSGSNALSGMQKHDSAVNRFVEKARLLAEFRNEPCVAGVYDYFRQNHTAYMVMEQPGGLSMQTYVWKKGPVPAESLLELMKPMMRTLQQIHRKGLIHRNICPENIRMYADGSMKLVNFGTVSGAVDENSLKPGYAPVELYGFHGRPGPWSDVYALCAGIYTCITGVVPQLSVERAAQDELRRPSEYGVQLSARQEAALMRGLAVWPEARLQSVAQLMDELDLTEPEEAVPVFVPQQEQPEADAVEAPVEAPRWEPVEDPATWEDMPAVSDAPAPMDPVMRQGRSYAAPAFIRTQWEADTMWEASGGREEAERFAQEEPEQTSLWETLMPEGGTEEAPAEVQIEEVTEEAVEEATEEAVEEAAEEVAEGAVEEATEEATEETSVGEDWQGDYKPVEPIDPKFWQKELGLEEPDAPMPWEEAPGAWEETPKPWDVPEPWQEEAETPAPEKKKKLVPIIILAAVILAAAAAALFFFLNRGSGADDLVLTLDGIAYELPCTLAELNEDGWIAEDVEENEMVGVQSVLYLGLEKTGSIRVLAENTGDAEVPMAACVVTRIAVSDPVVPVKAGGIDLQTSLETVIDTLGKPSQQTDDSASYRDSDGYLWTFTKADGGEGLKSIVVEKEQ